MKKSYYYAGYVVRFDPSAPKSGQWRADCHGCGLNHNNEAGLIKLIDQKIAESRARRNEK